MHALARGAARASGFCHHLSTFDAVWEFVYRVLRSPEGALLRAISTLGYQSHHTAKAGCTDCRPTFTQSYMGPNSMYQC